MSEQTIMFCTYATSTVVDEIVLASWRLGSMANRQRRDSFVCHNMREAFDGLCVAFASDIQTSFCLEICARPRGMDTDDARTSSFQRRLSTREGTTDHEYEDAQILLLSHFVPDRTFISEYC